MCSISEVHSIGDMEPKFIFCARRYGEKLRRFFKDAETIDFMHLGVVLLWLRHRAIALGEKSNDDRSIGKSGVRGELLPAVDWIDYYLCVVRDNKFSLYLLMVGMDRSLFVSWKLIFIVNFITITGQTKKMEITSSAINTKSHWNIGHNKLNTLN